MARGDRGKMIFMEKEDHFSFLDGQSFSPAAGDAGSEFDFWDEGLVGSFGQGWNRRHQCPRYIFEGRYKSLTS